MEMRATSSPAAAATVEPRRTRWARDRCHGDGAEATITEQSSRRQCRVGCDEIRNFTDGAAIPLWLHMGLNGMINWQKIDGSKTVAEAFNVWTAGVVRESSCACDVAPSVPAEIHARKTPKHSQGPGKVKAETSLIASRSRQNRSVDHFCELQCGCVLFG